MTKTHQFKKEYSYELVKIAGEDYDSLEVLFAAAKGRKENIGFLAQQVIEKSVKAVLCFLEVPVPITHNLEILFDKVPKESEFQIKIDISELSLFASIRRYEDTAWELDKLDLKSLVDFSKSVLGWAQSQVKPII